MDTQPPKKKIQDKYVEVVMISYVYSWMMCLSSFPAFGIFSASFFGGCYQGETRFKRFHVDEPKNHPGSEETEISGMGVPSTRESLYQWPCQWPFQVRPKF